MITMTFLIHIQTRLTRNEILILHKNLENIINRNLLALTEYNYALVLEKQF